ncbi:MAG TPA: hypothetical protein PK467_00855 [Candidatus Wallbacteria bacterium]|nr:hypothetical protein [Candidatus Wallbacteria bacterium]
MNFITGAKKNILFIVSYFIASLAFCLTQGCSCESKKHEIKILEPAGVRVDELRKGRMINAFHAYLKEVDNNAIMKKIKKNVGSAIIGMATTEVTVLAPYEEACIEGMKYYSVSKFDDAARCFKRALSYPNVPAFKTLEIKFLLMDSLRQSGKESEYMSQLNEYKQKYREIVIGAEPEFLLNQQKSAIIFTSLEKSGEKLNANIETGKTEQQ